ncbi:DUF3168 domain-containing protein [Kordiimonas marina]|uniref:DUF3168 domain-containing protein n=1 Tax=Kordiimonas marina TaxID=2872312 RepID=UPI001FF60C63|nr:DUF3168 domain-containing protein [Kordiimonas marina]MCJ9428691.1 DUF3168 domain-containing protein [Kordiimonas marina]
MTTMTALCADKLQVAVYAALKADPDLAAMLTGFYDEPVEEAQCPYLAMGDTSLSDHGLKDRGGASVLFEIQLWSNEPSQMEAKELIARADKVLVAAELAVTGYTLVSLSLNSAGVSRSYSASGSLYMGRLSYSALLYEA